MRALPERRTVAGTTISMPVFWVPVRSKNVVASIAVPNTPMPLGERFTFSFGAKPVDHSPSWRVRLNCALSSYGRSPSNAQVGVAAAKRSRLYAEETHDSTLQLPASDTSDVSTWYAVPAARGAVDVRVVAAATQIATAAMQCETRMAGSPRLTESLDDFMSQARPRRLGAQLFQNVCQKRHGRAVLRPPATCATIGLHPG